MAQTYMYTRPDPLAWSARARDDLHLYFRLVMQPEKAVSCTRLFCFGTSNAYVIDGKDSLLQAFLVRERHLLKGFCEEH